MPEVNYKRHLEKRHIRRVMSREEHNDNHSLNPGDYDHYHER